MASRKLPFNFRALVGGDRRGRHVGDGIDLIDVEPLARNAQADVGLVLMIAVANLSSLLAPHPLQVRAGSNQLKPLLVAVTDGELLHTWGLSSTSGAAPHAIRTWRRALLNL